MEHRKNTFSIHTIGKSLNFRSNHKMNEKRNQVYQSMDPEYVTGQINSHNWKLLLRRFCCLNFVPSQKF